MPLKLSPQSELPQPQHMGISQNNPYGVAMGLKKVETLYYRDPRRRPKKGSSIG